MTRMTHLPHLPHLLLTLVQATPAKAASMGVLKRLGLRLTHLGSVGLLLASLFDSALIPIPWQPILIQLVSSNPGKFLLYPLLAAVASAIGSLVPFYVGRLGGELFLLGKINRERYERLRDRFERQEFLAILIPAIGPPPTPFKLFEFCAGVFEMKPLTFLLAAFLGKLVQFTAYATLTHLYGPAVMDLIFRTVRQHAHLLLFVLGLLLVVLAIWVVRKIFDRKRGTRLPIEEGSSAEERQTVIVEE
ncbi:MAG: YqaA family protein [Janthinobacterium lividum]